MTLASNIYFDSYFNIDAVKILPGEYYATTRPMLIVTVLGSCVAACIRDRVSGIGGMNHFMLPATNNLDEFFNTSGCFGIYAMERLINKLLEIGALHKNLEAKIFGGGNMFPNHVTSQSINVGQRNGLAAKELLLKNGIPIKSEYLFGVGHRQVIFDVCNGNVWSKQVKPNES